MGARFLLQREPSSSTGGPDCARQNLTPSPPLSCRLVPLKDHFPPSYIGARCLCHGCIRISQSGEVLQDPSFNSAAVKQSRPFLKKTRCTDEPGYRLEHVSVAVPVGCTCVRPNTVTS